VHGQPILKYSSQSADRVPQAENEYFLTNVQTKGALSFLILTLLVFVFFRLRRENDKIYSEFC
jgi:hypothetical protein